MSTTRTLSIDDGNQIAYQKLEGAGPVVVFLSGHGSDMFGTKAEALLAYCQDKGQAFLRFDYTGHGLSSGAFLEGTISSWTRDALAVIDQLTTGDVVLVGSSLGGWIMLNVAKQRGMRIKGCIGIAAAPDFTNRLIWNELSAAQQEQMMRDGQIALPNPYADEDVIYPYALVEDGRNNLLLEAPLDVTCPIILHQGMADHEVPWTTACDIAEVVASDDVQIHLRKDSGHRFSSDEEISDVLASVSALLEGLSKA